MDSPSVTSAGSSSTASPDFANTSVTGAFSFGAHPANVTATNAITSRKTKSFFIIIPPL